MGFTALFVFAERFHHLADDHPDDNKGGDTDKGVGVEIQLPEVDLDMALKP